MNKLAQLTVFCGFLCTYPLLLLGQTCEHSADEDPTFILGSELRAEFSKPNKWGYRILWALGPHMSPNGLTYNIHFLADMWGKRVTSIKEAEELHSEIYKNGLQIINSIHCIRPFLGDFPLSPDSLQISVGFSDERGNNLLAPCIASVTMDAKKLEFNQYLGKRHLPSFKTILEKEIREVPELLSCYHTAVPRSGTLATPVTIPSFTTPPERCIGPYGKEIFNFSKKVTSENCLNLTAVASVCGYTTPTRPFEIAFWGHQSLLLPDARKLTAQVSSRFLEFVQKNAEAIKRLQTWKENHPNAAIPDVASPSNIALRLSFWDVNIDRQAEPYIAEVRLCNGKTTYYTADENQFLKQVFEESYEDALKTLEPQKDAESTSTREP